MSEQVPKLLRKASIRLDKIVSKFHKKSPEIDLITVSKGESINPALRDKLMAIKETKKQISSEINRQLKKEGQEMLNQELEKIVKSVEKQHKKNEKVIEDLEKGIQEIIDILNSSKKTLAKSKSMSVSDIIKEYM